MPEAVKIEGLERIEEDQPDQDINLQRPHFFDRIQLNMTLVGLEITNL